MSIYLVLSLELLNQTCGRAGRVVLALYALHLGAQPVTVGLLAATFSVFPMVLAVPAGKLADRFGARWLLIAGAIGGGIGMLIPYFVAGIGAIFIAAALIGASNAIYNVSLQNLVGLLSTQQNRSRNFANYSLTASLSNFLGPLIAGFSIDHWGHAGACLTITLLVLAPLALLMARARMLPRGGHHAEHASGRLTDMLADRGVRKTLATSSLLHAGSDLFQFYLPIYGHNIGLSASAIGIVLAMNSAAAFAVRSVLPRLIDRYKEERVLVAAFVGGALGILLIPFSESGVVLALIAFVYGLGMGCGQPVVTMLMFGNAPAGRSGEALGLRMTVNHLTRVVGPVIFGAIGSAFGLATVFWVTSAMLGGGGLLNWPGDRGGGDRAAPPRGGAPRIPQ